MNTLNHHRVLDEAGLSLFKQALKDKSVSPVHESFTKNINLLMEASDYTDHISRTLFDEDPFFFFHFYYDIVLPKNIQINKGVIELKRRGKDGTDYKTTYLNCTLGDKRISSETGNRFKSFFSTINKSDHWLKKDVADKSNQSDCVAFLHAMSASKKVGKTVLVQSVDDATDKFKEHLKKCFLEYLFLKDDDQALFFLGIALHGIMDSFTPSHMDFQPYAIQKGKLHAQGDVLPFRGDTVRFIPGQYTNDAIASQNNKSIKSAIFNKTKMAALFKWYNGNDDIGKEFEMFKVFVAIGGLEENATITAILEGKIDITEYKTVYDEFTVHQVPYMSKKRLNEIIKDIKYDESAFVWSDAAVCVVAEVFKYLFLIRNQEGYSYEKYKEAKEKIKDALDIWENEYNGKESMRTGMFERLRDIRHIDDTKNPFE